MKIIVDAFEYKIWADQRTVQAVANVNKSAFSGSYKFFLQQINHMIIVEDLFKARLTNQRTPHENTNTDIVPEFSVLTDRLSESGQWYLSYASNLDKLNLEDFILFTFADGKPGSMSVAEILFHIINHSSYHRGSIAHALDLTNVPHPVDGYGIYIHEKEPKRREQT